MGFVREEQFSYKTERLLNKGKKKLKKQ